jgi:hypothetical protein
MGGSVIQGSELEILIVSLFVRETLISETLSKVSLLKTEMIAGSGNWRPELHRIKSLSVTA